jgi:hypothetical protein
MICQHGHEHNIFEDGEVHTCKGCVVCDFIIAQGHKAPSREDLVRQLIDAVHEATRIDGLPCGRYGVELEAPDLRLYIHDEPTLRQKMIDLISEWGKAQLFRKNGAKSPKEE